MNKFTIRLSLEKPDGGVVETEVLYYLDAEKVEAIAGFNWLLDETSWPDKEEIYEAIAEA